MDVRPEFLQRVVPVDGSDDRIAKALQSHRYKRSNEGIVLDNQNRFSSARDKAFVISGFFRRSRKLRNHLRQIHPYRRSKPWRAMDGNMTIRLFCETVDHAQTKAAALADLFCRVKWLEHALDYFLRHAFTVIRDGDQDIFARENFRLKAPLG